MSARFLGLAVELPVCVRYSPGMDLRAGQVVGAFELVEPAGAGGFSVVWKARRVAGGEVVALKLPQVAGRLDPPRRGAGLGRGVADPQVVPVLEAHLASDPPHLVMPWVEGRPFEPPAAPPPPREIVRALERVADVAAVVG